VSVSLSDAFSGIDAASSTLSLDGGPVAAPSRSASSVSFAPAADLADGWHVVDATVRDNGGNLASLTTARFGVDVTPPAPATVTGLVADQVVAGVVTIGGQSSDATSGVERIELLRGGALFQTITAPAVEAAVTTATIPEGRHTISARAVDRAGNRGPEGAPVPIVVDNYPMTLVITAPTANTRVRTAVTVKASVSELADRIEFTVAGVTVTDFSAPFEAVVDVSVLADGPRQIAVRAFGAAAEDVSAAVTVLVDHTAPSPPNAARIDAEAQDAGYALVRGSAGAVEARAIVKALPPVAGNQVLATAASDGTFVLRMRALEGDVLVLTATDEAGNESAATTVTVAPRRTQDGVPLAGMRMWVKPEVGIVSDGGRVTRWEDQSGQNNHLIQSSVDAQPSFVADAGNGRPAVRFDGANDWLQFTTRITTVRTVFWVVRETAGTPNGYRYLLGDGTEFHFHSGSGHQIWGSDHASAHVLNGQTFVNGAAVDGATTNRPSALSVVSVITTGPVSAASLASDRSLGRHWWGDVAELIVYDVPLSGTDHKAVEDHLARKHGLYIPTVATPIVMPNGGTFEGSTTVALSTTTAGATIRYTLNGGEVTSTSAVYTEPFLVSESVIVKARAFRDSLPESGTATATFLRGDDPSSPARLPGLRLWLRADAGVSADPTGRVSTWRDQSGASNEAVQPLGSNRPLLVADEANGLPVVRFDGSNDWLQLPAAISSLRTVFMVVREDPVATAGQRTLLSGPTNDDYAFYGGFSRQLWSSSAHAAVRDGQTLVNGVQVDGLTTNRPTALSIVSVVTTAPVTVDRFSRDRNGAAYWWGDLAELIVYDTPLTATDRRAVEDYLAVKYATRLTAAAPAITPAGGTFTGSATVTMASRTPGADVRYTLDGTDPTAASSVYVEPLTVTSTTTVKARAFRADLTASDINTAGFVSTAHFNPSSLAGLKLWLRADAGLPVDRTTDRWEDQSGLANHAVQATGTLMPTAVHGQANGLPVVRFDGANDWLQFTSAIPSLRTVFMVVREDPLATAGQRTLLSGPTNDDYAFYGGFSRQLWNSSAHAAVRDGQTLVNGVQVNGLTTNRPTALSIVSVVTTAPVMVDRFSRDRNGAAYWWGDLAELIVYETALTAADRVQVENYLNARYRMFIR
jgi:hypothetical protein